ncbi:MAG: hypothetical protein ABJB86_00125 [Bacteroidota bacterium]
MKLFLSYRALLLTLFILAGTIAVAQDSATDKFLDSLKKPAPLLQDKVALPAETKDSTTDDEATDTAAEEMPVDTNIVSRLRPISADSFELIKKDKGFYYQKWLDSLLRAETKVTKKPRAPVLPDLSGFFTVFQIVLWVLATAVLLFVLYKLFVGKNSLFVNNRKNIDAAINIEEEPSANQYESLIKKAEAEKNYRLAVRYLYLQSLYHLSEKNYIIRGTEKTNYQYINELKKRPAAFAHLFSSLTFKYEYTWYGEYPVNEIMYEALRGSFRDLNNEIV